MAASKLYPTLIYYPQIGLVLALGEGISKAPVQTIFGKTKCVSRQVYADSCTIYHIL